MTEEKKFSFQAITAFVTWSKCPLAKEAILEAVKNRCDIVQYVIGRERHADGSFHIHACFKFAKRLHTENARFFDIDGYHPNFKAPKKEYLNKVEYCMKDGDYIIDGINFWKNSKGFKRKYEDQQAWFRMIKYKALQEVKWPIKLPDGQEIEKSTEKGRHWWIVGAPNKGKTTWAKQQFAFQKVFWRRLTKHPYEGYQGEEIIVIDDFFPKFEELANICEDWYQEIHVFGDTRYNQTYWPIGQFRTVFILSNEEPNYFKHQEAFEARFNILNLE